MSELVKRSITGIIFIAVVISSIILDSYLFILVFSVFTGVGIYELYKISSSKGLMPQLIPGIVAGITIFVVLSLFFFNKIDNSNYLILLFPLTVLFFVIELFRQNASPFNNIAITFLGIIYVAIPFALSSYIVSINYKLLIGILILQWAYDTLAYCTGTLIGKHKMLPKISPKKSWEGFAGGAVGSLVIAYFLSGIFQIEEIQLFDWIIISIIVIIFGTLGDFIESSLKRSFDVKDSGTILPGHGGILDRFDSLIFAMPFVFAYLFLIL